MSSTPTPTPIPRTNTSGTGTLRRPKSTIFATAENRMKRLTSFLAPSDAPPTPPISQAEDFLASGTANPRHGPPNLTLEVPNRRPSVAMSQFDGSVGHNVYGAPRNFSTSNLLTPGGSVGTPTSRHVSSQFANFSFDPQDPILQAPNAPFAAGSRPGSRGSNYGSRPGTPGSLMGKSYASSSYSGVTPVTTEIPKLRKRRAKKGEATQLAWKLAPDSSTTLEQYEIGPLFRGEKCTDLWFPDGDTLVYLQSSDKMKSSKPVFRIHSTPLIFAALNHCVEDSTLSQEPPKERSSEEGAVISPDDLFLEVPPPAGGQESDPANADKSPASPNGSEDGAKSPDTRSSSPKSPASPTSQSPVIGSYSGTPDGERPPIYKLYYPLDEETQEKEPGKPRSKKKLTKQPKYSASQAQGTLQQYIDARNLFAFISRTFLVASQARDTGFQVLSKIWLQLGLNEAEMYPYDMQANSRMFLAETHLQVYIDELVLDDVRNDDDLIIETLILGERWRSQRLYHEAFLHACGRWDDLKTHEGMKLVSPTTKSKLDRASIDLHNLRLTNIHTMIPNFDFPSFWVGCGKYSEFKPWRSAYDKMRAMVLAHMKHVFGGWPPRPGRTGKGGGYTATGGLNRITLKRLYDDLCAVYDLCVDHEWLHGERIRGGDGQELPENLKHKQTTMRKIMQEFDNANVPCQPEIPFNLPRMPVRAGAPQKPKKRSFWSREKKISEAEVDAMLKESYNQDAHEQHKDNFFVKEFIASERAFAVGRSVEDLADFRRGRWLFMYCVLQVLPMVVVDGAGLAHGDGVEYFLCENVKGGMPWEKSFNKRNTRMSGMWHAAPDGSLVGIGGMGASSTNLLANVNPDDEIELIYRRSHCWVVSEQWRLVEGEDDEDDGSYEDEIVGYDPEGRPIYAGEYAPGQVLPDSPTGSGFHPTGSPYAGSTSNPSIRDLNTPVSPDANTGPAWAQRAKQNYQSPPTVDTASSSSRPTSVRSPSQQTGATNITSPTELQIQPFEFEIEKKGSQPGTPTGGSTGRNSPAVRMSPRAGQKEIGGMSTEGSPRVTARVVEDQEQVGGAF